MNKFIVLFFTLMLALIVSAGPAFAEGCVACHAKLDTFTGDQQITAKEIQADADTIVAGLAGNNQALFAMIGNIMKSHEGDAARWVATQRNPASACGAPDIFLNVDQDGRTGKNLTEVTGISPCSKQLNALTSRHDFTAKRITAIAAKGDRDSKSRSTALANSFSLMTDEIVASTAARGNPTYVSDTLAFANLNIDNAAPVMATNKGDSDFKSRSTALANLTADPTFDDSGKLVADGRNPSTTYSEQVSYLVLRPATTNNDNHLG